MSNAEWSLRPSGTESCKQQGLLLELLSTLCHDSVATIAKFATVDTPFCPVDRIPNVGLILLSKCFWELRITLLSRQSRPRRSDSRQTIVSCDNSSSYYRTTCPWQVSGPSHKHTKPKVVNELSKPWSPEQLYGCHPKSCQSCQRWQPKSCYHDNPSQWQLFAPNFSLRVVKKGTVTVTTLTTQKWPYWLLFDNSLTSLHFVWKCGKV